MNKKLKLRLINALKKAGMAEGLAEMFEGNSEQEVLKFINELPEQSAGGSDDLTAEELAESDLLVKAVEHLGFDKLLSKSKAMQSAHDKKVTQGVNTFKKKMLGEDEDEDEPKKKSGNEEMPAWAKALMDKVDTLETNNKTKSAQQQATELMAKSKLPKKFQSRWVNRIDPNSEKSIEDQVKELETEFTDLYGSIASENNYEFTEGTRNEGKLSANDEAELSDLAKTI